MPDKRVARGIWRTPTGWRLYVRVGTKLRPKRVKDPLHMMGLVELKQIKEDHRTDKRRESRIPAPAEPGTFADDVHRKYLPAVKAKISITERTYHMELWIAEFGSRLSSSIEPWEIQKVRDRWLTEGPKRVCVKWGQGERPPGCKTGKWIEVATPLSARQVNNRLRALENFFTVVFGTHVRNPVREAGEAAEPESRPRAQQYDVIEQILEAMPDRGRTVPGEDRSDVSLTKLRLKCIAYVGLSHGELAGITEPDLHLDEKPPWVWVAGREKGEGTKGVAQPLTRRGAAALRALWTAGGLGPFSRASMRKSFIRACRNLDLSGIRPYDLRHSFATEVLKKLEGNIGALQLVMRHRDPRTALIYSQAAIDPVRAAAVKTVQARKGFVTSKVTGGRGRRAKLA